MRADYDMIAFAIGASQSNAPLTRDPDIYAGNALGNLKIWVLDRRSSVSRCSASGMTNV